MLDARTRTLYSRKRESKYTRKDNERSIGIAALILAVAVALPIVLARVGLVSPQRYHPATRVVAGWWTTYGAVNVLLFGGLVAAAAFSGLVWLVHQYRHRHDPIDVVLPPITPPACTFFSRDFVLGQGCTEDGLQPGDVFPAARDDADLLPEFNVFIRGEGAFQNTKLEGAPGTGKSSMIEALIAQAVRKYPAPPPLPRDEAGAWMPLPAWDTAEHERLLQYVEHARKQFLAWEARMPRIISHQIAAIRGWRDRKLGGTALLDAASDPIIVAAYGGIATEAEAEARRAELVKRHKRRPTVLVINAKPESEGKSLVDHLVRCAAADSPERSAQVYLVSPDLGTSVAMFDLARTNADLASTISTTISIIDGETDRFWTGQMTSLVACLVGVMKAVMPGRITWLTLLNLLRAKETFDDFVSDARARFETQAEAERKNAPIEGPRVNHVELSELERFSQLDPKKFVETTAHILNFGGKLTAGDLVRTMAPEVPTYGTMDEVVREGGLLGVDMPLTRYQDVSRAVVTMLVNAYVAAIMEVARTTPADEMRESYVFFDEAASYMTEVLERALSQNRSAQLGVFLAYQIRTQFDATDTTASKTLGTTCANTISFRDPDGVSAELKSRSYGMRETLVEDYGITENLGRVQGTSGRAGDAAGLTQSGSVRQSLRDLPRFKPEVVQSLPQGHAIVMVSDGRNPYPARRIKTLRTVDIPWLSSVESINASAHGYVPPIPVCVLAGDDTDWTALDRMKVLAEASDPTRDDVIAMRSLWSEGKVWGVVLYTRTFACVLELQHVVRHSTLIEQALTGILKPGYPTPFQPTVVLTDVADGRVLSQAPFNFDIAMPFPIVEAAAAVLPPSPERVAAARAAADGLSGNVDDYLTTTWSGGRASVRGIPWFTVSQAMRAVLDVYKDVDSYLRQYDATLPQHLRAEWSDAIRMAAPIPSAPPRTASSSASAMPAPAPGAVSPPADSSSGTTAPAEQGSQPRGRRRAAAVPTVDAVLAFLQGDGATDPATAAAPTTIPTTPAVAPTTTTNDESDPSAPGPASESTAAGSLNAGESGVLAGAGAAVSDGNDGDGSVLGANPAGHGTAVRGAAAGSPGDVGIPRDNPFDI